MCWGGIFHWMDRICMVHVSSLAWIPKQYYGGWRTRWRIGTWYTIVRKEESVCNFKGLQSTQICSCLMKYHTTHDFSRGTCPTIVSAFITITAYNPPDFLYPVYTELRICQVQVAKYLCICGDYTNDACPAIIPNSHYKRMSLTNKVNFEICFSKNYKCIR